MSSSSFAQQTNCLLQAVTSRTKTSRATADFNAHARKVSAAGPDAALTDVILLYTYTAGAFKPPNPGHTDRMRVLLDLIGPAATDEYRDLVMAGYAATEGFKLNAAVFANMATSGRFPTREGWVPQPKFVDLAVNDATQLAVMSPKEFADVRVSVALRCILEFAGARFEGAPAVARMVIAADNANPCGANKVLSTAARGVLADDVVVRRSSRFTKEGIALMRGGTLPPSSTASHALPATDADAALRIQAAIARSKAKAGGTAALAAIVGATPAAAAAGSTLAAATTHTAAPAS